MNAVKRRFSTVLICSVALTTSAFGQDRTLTMHDVSPDLAGLIGNTDLDFVRAAEIKYGHVNKSNYDDFFRSSAIAYGGLVAGQGLVDDATMNIKASARSKVAVAELQDQISELTEDADTSTWDVETSFAVLQAAEMKDQLSEDEKSYMAGAAIRMVALVPVVESSVSSSADLIDEAPGLVSGARSAFGLRKAGGMARNVRTSADRISNIPTEGAGLLEQLVVLNRGFAMLRSLNADD